MDDKLMFAPNDDNQNYFCLNLIQPIKVYCFSKTIQPGILELLTFCY